MEELFEDHRKGREHVTVLVAAKDKYVKGVAGQVGTILDELRFFVDFYPKHIEKEDNHFFIPVMSYFGKEEKDAMLDEESAFDKELIHRIYTERVVAGEQGG